MIRVTCMVRGAGKLFSDAYLLEKVVLKNNFN